jgi:hypothetical protein
LDSIFDTNSVGVSLALASSSVLLQNNLFRGDSLNTNLVESAVTVVDSVREIIEDVILSLLMQIFALFVFSDSFSFFFFLFPLHSN